MIRKIAGLETNNRYLLVSTLVLMLGAGGCNLLKNLLKKGDTGADASAAPSAIAAGGRRCRRSPGPARRALLAARRGPAGVPRGPRARRHVNVG